jgi:hypothetical protein
MQQVTRCVIEFCCTGRQFDAARATSKSQRRGQEPHRAVLRAEVFDTVGVATALAALAEEDHPLVTRPPSRGGHRPPPGLPEVPK